MPRGVLLLNVLQRLYLVGGIIIIAEILITLPPSNPVNIDYRIIAGKAFDYAVLGAMIYLVQRFDGKRILEYALYLASIIMLFIFDTAIDSTGTAAVSEDNIFALAGLASSFVLVMAFRLILDMRKSPL